jgi:mannitol/fructose-specific phosphotransferase system IIA component (Ntr-type)
MKLGDFFAKEAVIPELRSADRNGVIKEMVAAIAKAGAIDPDEVEAVARAVISRENQGSTGFGKGVAIPHAKNPSVKRMVATIGRSGAGVDFTALDRAPVYVVVMLLSPPDAPDQHLAAMETIFRHLQRDNFRKFLRQAESAQDIIDLIIEADEAETAS